MTRTDVILLVVGVGAAVAAVAYWQQSAPGLATPIRPAIPVATLQGLGTPPDPVRQAQRNAGVLFDQ